MDKATGQNTPANRPNVRVVICCCGPFELAASFLLKLRVSAQIGLLLESEWVMRGERSSSAVESILWSCDNSPLIEYEWDITLWPWLYQITPCLLHLLWSQISCFFSVSRDAEIIWFVLNAELDAQTVIFRRRKSLIQNLGTDCWYWCDSRVHDGNIEFQKRDKGSWSLFTVIRYTVTCTWLQIECVWPWHPPPLFQSLGIIWYPRPRTCLHIDKFSESWF